MISRRHPVLKAVWAVGIATISVTSILVFDPGAFLAGMSDKLGHFLAYFGVALIGFLAATTTRHRVQIAAGMLILGLTLEILQIFTPNRLFEWADWLADGSGIALAFGVYRLIKKIRSRS